MAVLSSRRWLQSSRSLPRSAGRLWRTCPSGCSTRRAKQPRVRPRLQRLMPHWAFRLGLSAVLPYPCHRAGHGALQRHAARLPRGPFRAHGLKQSLLQLALLHRRALQSLLQLAMARPTGRVHPNQRRQTCSWSLTSVRAPTGHQGQCLPRGVAALAVPVWHRTRSLNLTFFQI